MAAKTLYRVDDLLTLEPPPTAKAYELRHGELIEVGRAKVKHERTKSNIVSRLNRAVPYESFAVLIESMIQIDEDNARIPDIAVFRREESAAIDDESVGFTRPPEVAIEVISDSEMAASCEEKVVDYFEFGVKEVWQVFPDFQKVLIRRPGSARELTGDATVTTDVLPGFSASLPSFFRR